MHGLVIGSNVSLMSRILSNETNLVIWQRNLSNFLDSWSCEIRWERTEVLEGEFDRRSLECFEEDLYGELKKWRSREPDLNRWVASDMCSNIRSFMDATNANQVVVKIEPVYTDKCRLFHVDNNLIRMLCTYVGEGTLCLPNDKVQRNFLGKGKNEDIIMDPQGIYQLSKLDVVLLKGEKWPNNFIGGAVHRSPVLRPDGKRLLLKVDFLS